MIGGVCSGMAEYLISLDLTCGQDAAVQPLFLYWLYSISFILDARAGGRAACCCPTPPAILSQSPGQNPDR